MMSRFFLPRTYEKFLLLDPFFVLAVLYLKPAVIKKTAGCLFFSSEPLSDHVSPCHYMSVLVNICQSMSVHVITCQSMSVHVSRCQSLSIYVSQCQSMSVHVRPCHKISEVPKRKVRGRHRVIVSSYHCVIKFEKFPSSKSGEDILTSCHSVIKTSKDLVCRLSFICYFHLTFILYVWFQYSLFSSRVPRLTSSFNYFLFVFFCKCG